jgi:hypothetical protein
MFGPHKRVNDPRYFTPFVGKPTYSLLLWQLLQVCGVGTNCLKNGPLNYTCDSSYSMILEPSIGYVCVLYSLFHYLHLRMVCIALYNM